MNDYDVPQSRLDTRIKLPEGELTAEQINITVERANEWFEKSGKLLTDTVADKVRSYLDSHIDAFQSESARRSEDIDYDRQQAEVWKSNIKAIADKYPDQLGDKLMRSLDDFKGMDANQIQAALDKYRPAGILNRMDDEEYRQLRGAIFEYHNTNNLIADTINSQPQAIYDRLYDYIKTGCPGCMESLTARISEGRDFIAQARMQGNEVDDFNYRGLLTATRDRETGQRRQDFGYQEKTAQELRNLEARDVMMERIFKELGI
jgi:hypothetical protein